MPNSRIINADKAVRVTIADLAAHPMNANHGSVPKIAESLRELGQFRPIVVNRGTHTGRPDEILAGHHLVLAALELGWETVSVTYVDVDDELGRRIMLADNATRDAAVYDDRMLVELLESLPDLKGTGFDQAGLDQLLASLEGDPHEGHTGPDDVPALRPAAVSRLGDVWVLGPHRLLVGDCTELPAVSALMAGEPADMVWTDPPYGVEYVGGTKDKLTIQNDGGAGLPSLLGAAFQVVAAVARPGAPVYVAHAGTQRIAFETAMLAAKLSVRQELVWVKPSLVLGRSDFHYRHEPILDALTALVDEGGEVEPKTHESLLYGFTAAPKGSGRLGRGGPHWFGGNKQTTVFEVPKPAASVHHPTMKPTELIERMIRVSCRPGGVVFDGFGGSGSTLIAAERLGRRARLVELDPVYADVICRRWRAFSGQPATRAGQLFPPDELDEPA